VLHIVWGVCSDLFFVIIPLAKEDKRCSKGNNYLGVAYYMGIIFYIRLDNCYLKNISLLVMYQMCC
ncbi:hypothetical protein, partial [uncultured Capnocytophaga sp.]|uniref:hypothetical protein n=1 Tax=uncultured Capnocytophaga sp. TaxID=159273 RepID=UPI0026168ECA